LKQKGLQGKYFMIFLSKDNGNHDEQE